MRTCLVALIALAAGALFPPAAGGHHPLAELYDRDRTVTLTGVVRVVEWANPHVAILADVRNGPAVHTWRLEMSSPGGMVRRGLRLDQFRSGDELVVTGYPAKDGSPSAVARTIGLPSGQTVEVTDDSSRNWQRMN